MENCYMCHGWGVVHPVDIGRKLDDGNPMYIWVASIAAYSGGDIECPVCKGAGKAELPTIRHGGKVLTAKSMSEIY